MTPVCSGQGNVLSVHILKTLFTLEYEVQKIYCANTPASFAHYVLHLNLHKIFTALTVY